MSSAKSRERRRAARLGRARREDAARTVIVLVRLRILGPELLGCYPRVYAVHLANVAERELREEAIVARARAALAELER